MWIIILKLLYGRIFFIQMPHSLCYTIALSKMEELLMEMRTDVARLPNELAKLQSVSKQLKMDEISTISKLAKGSSSTQIITPAPTQSVIAKAPAASDSLSHTGQAPVKKERLEVIQTQKKKGDVSQSKVATLVQAGTGQLAAGSGQVIKAGQTIQIPAGHKLVQTADGLFMYSTSTSGSNTSQQPTVMQAVPVSKTTTQQAYTIGVPAAYVDSSMYQTVQLVPVSGSTQQLMYWPTAQASSGVPVGSQIAVVQEPQVVQAVQYSVAGGTVAGTLTASGNTGSSIITID